MAPLRLGDLFDAPRARGVEPALLVLEGVRRMIAQPARALCRQPALISLPRRPDFSGGNRSPTGRRGGAASAPIPFFRSGVGRAGPPAAVWNILHALLLRECASLRGESQAS